MWLGSGVRGESKSDTCGASWVYGLAGSWVGDVRAAVGIRPPANGQAWTRRVPHGLRYMAMLGLALDLALGSPPLECADAPCFLTPAACATAAAAPTGPRACARASVAPLEHMWEEAQRAPTSCASCASSASSLPALCQRPPAARLGPCCRYAQGAGWMPVPRRDFTPRLATPGPLRFTKTLMSFHPFSKPLNTPSTKETTPAHEQRKNTERIPFAGT